MRDANNPLDRRLDAIERRIVELDAELLSLGQDPVARLSTTQWRRRYRRLIAEEHKLAAAIARRHASA